LRSISLGPSLRRKFARVLAESLADVVLIVHVGIEQSESAGGWLVLCWRGRDSLEACRAYGWVHNERHTIMRGL
jgi:hypothetical protein